MIRNCIFSIVWILVLWFIAWPLAALCAGFWILLQPFEALLACVKSVNEFLEKFVVWPRALGHAIVNGESTFPSPL